MTAQAHMSGDSDIGHEQREDVPRERVFSDMSSLKM